MTKQPTTTRPAFTSRAAVAAVGLATTVALGIGVMPADATLAPVKSTSTVVRAAPPARGAVPESVTTPVARAHTSLARAIVQIRAHHPARAATWLDRLRHQVIAANVAAKNQIGRPPIDPESDDAPGPPAVMSALRLDHQVTTSVVGLFDGRKNATVMLAQRRVLYATLVRRDTLLDAVIALPAEGEGADYADGLADTLGWYTAEVNSLRTGLATFRLSAAGRLGLSNSLTRVTATKAKVDLAFGGGERSPR
jgi:hypothetical protein